MTSAVLLSEIGSGKEWKLESGILPDFEMKNRKKGGKKRNKED
jgi:hypothetical protein